MFSGGNDLFPISSDQLAHADLVLMASESRQISWHGQSHEWNRKRKDTMQFHIRHLRAFLTILFMVFALRIASAQPLSVSPVSFDLGRFPAWKSQTQTFTARNTGESTVNLLRVRSSCSCLAADFQPCTLEAGQETALTVTIPANSVSGDFSKTVFLETDVPGQEFLKLTVSGTAVPAVEVQPKREVYLGRLEAGKERVCVFRLIPASPEMKLRLLPEAPDCASQSELVQEDDGTYRLELHIRPDAFRRFVLLQRQIAIDWQEEALPLLEIKIRYTIGED